MALHANTQIKHTHTQNYPCQMIINRTAQNKTRFRDVELVNHMFLFCNSLEASSNIETATSGLPFRSCIIKAICSHEPAATAEQFKSGVLVITLKDLVNFRMPTAGKTIAFRH